MFKLVHVVRADTSQRSKGKNRLLQTPHPTPFYTLDHPAQSALTHPPYCSNKSNGERTPKSPIFPEKRNSHIFCYTPPFAMVFRPLADLVLACVVAGREGCAVLPENSVSKTRVQSTVACGTRTNYKSDKPYYYWLSIIKLAVTCCHSSYQQLIVGGTYSS